MHMRNRFALIASSALVWVSPLASAQYVGPSAAPAYASVAEVLKNPVEDAAVVFEGHVIRHLGKDKYVFTDGTAEIRIEVDQKHFPASPIDDKTKVRIRGEIERDSRQGPEIDVDNLEIVQ